MLPKANIYPFNIAVHLDKIKSKLWEFAASVIFNNRNSRSRSKEKSSIK